MNVRLTCLTMLAVGVFAGQGSATIAAETPWNSDMAPIAEARAAEPILPAPFLAPLTGRLLGGFPIFPTGCGSSIPYASVAAGSDRAVVVSNNCMAFLAGDVVNYSQMFSPGFYTTTPFFEPTGIPFSVQTLFDPHSERFVIAGVHSRARLALSLSKSSDPRAPWYKHHFINITQPRPIDASLPVVGVDARYIYVSMDFLFANSPSDPWSRSLVYIYDKADLSQDLNHAAPPVIIVEPVEGRAVRPFPALNYDVDAPAQYMVTPFGTPVGTSRLRLFAIDGLPLNPTVHSLELDVPEHLLNSTQVMPTPGNFSIFMDSSRIRSAVYRNGSLWTTLHLHGEDGERRVVRWFEIAMNGWPQSGAFPALRQVGDVESSEGAHTFEPSIAVNPSGQMALVYGETSPTQWPSAKFAWRQPNDPPGTLRNGGLLSQTPPFTSIGSTRTWGGQSSVSNDPLHPSTFLSMTMARGTHGNQGNSTTVWLTRFELDAFEENIFSDGFESN